VYQPSREVLAMLILPDIKAGAILADPALKFTSWSKKGEGRSPQSKYKCEAFEELAATPIASVAMPDCFLFVWWPLSSIYLVKPLMDAWGFTYSSDAFGWAKRTRRDTGWHMGCGYGTRKNLEICWLGRRGKPKRKSRGVRELIVAPVREHSRKPDETYGRVETFCDGPYLELWARQQWPGWTCVGDEIGKFDRRAS